MFFLIKEGVNGMKKVQEEEILTNYERWEQKDKKYEHFRLLVWIFIIILVCTIFLIAISHIK